MASQQVFEAADAFSLIKSATSLAVGVGVLAALTLLCVAAYCYR